MRMRLLYNPLTIAVGTRIASDIIEIGIPGLLNKALDSIALKIIEEERKNESTSKLNS